MGRFSAADRIEFLALRALCYSGLDSVTLRERLGARLREILNLDAYCLMELDSAVVLPTHGVTSGWSSEAHQLLVKHVLLASPVADLPERHRSGDRTWCADDLAVDRRHDPYFAFHLLPFGYRYDLLALCSFAGRPVGLLTLTRSVRRGAFQGRHRRLVDALTPHVAAGLRAAKLRETALAGADASTGVVVLDADGRLEFANAAGEAWLRQESADSRYWALSVPLLAALGIRGTVDQPSALPVLETRAGRTGVIHRLQAERLVDSSGHRRTLILIEPVRTIERPEILQQLGLTAREAEVAAGYLGGQGASELAQSLGCTRATVRVHLRNIFEKFDVSSRQELSALIAGHKVRQHSPL